MSLRLRLSALSIGVLLSLLVAGGTFQYLALGAILRRDAATGLRQHYAATVRNLVPLATPRRSGPSCSFKTARVSGGNVTEAMAVCLADVLSSRQLETVVLDRNARVLAASPSSSDYPTVPLGDYLATVRSIYATHPYRVADLGGDEQLVVLVPVTQGGTSVVGIAQLSTSTAPLRQTQGRLLLVLGVATGTLMLVALGVTPLLVGRALRPLRRVTEASVAVAGGDLARRVDEPRRSDEVGLLARAFNHMATAVQASLTVRAESERRMRRFVADASHELRTPLTTIQGQLDLLDRGAAEDPAVRHRSLESMQRETQRMSAMVEDLLTLTRLDSAAGGERELSRAPVDLATLVAESVEEQSVRSPEQRVEVSDPTGGQAIVMGDREQLRRAILNLANNALRHAPGKIHQWRVSLEAGFVVVSLADQGPGISNDDRERIFDRFYRGGSGTPRSGGSGLGLAIVRSIVEAHGGSIDASSDPVGGACFTMRLPRWAAVSPLGSPST
ncbi:MAG: sensor histidine kinase [Candidatus Dormibacteria bacterium]